MDKGRTPAGISAPRTQSGGQVPAPEHPTHPTATAPGPYLGAPRGGYGRSRGCATRPGHCMGRRGPAAEGERVRSLRWGPPRPGDPLVGDQAGMLGGTPAPLTRHNAASLHLICLHYFFPASSRCHRELARHWLSIPFPPRPSGTHQLGDHPRATPSVPMVLGGAETPCDGFPSTAGRVCSFPRVA